MISMTGGLFPDSVPASMYDYRTEIQWNMLKEKEFRRDRNVMWPIIGKNQRMGYPRTVGCNDPVAC